MDADVKTLVIAVSNGVQSIDATSRNLKQLIPLEITVVEGTRITWLNSDLDYSHSIVVKSQGTSKGVYASSPIRYSESADFTFSDTGTYLYSDPKYGDVRGIIHVIAKDTPIDNESTDTNTKIVGLFISGLGQKRQYDQLFSSAGHNIASSYVFFENAGSNSNSNNLGNVLYIWTSNIPGI